MIRLGLLFVLTSALTIGCGSTSGGNAGESNIAAASEAAEGEDCSGTDEGVQCAEGLTCALYDQPGAGGVCIPDPNAGEAGEGEDCSGTDEGVQCAEGLTCALHDQPGAGGVCIEGGSGG